MFCLALLVKFTFLFFFQRRSYWPSFYLLTQIQKSFQELLLQHIAFTGKVFFYLERECHCLSNIFSNNVKEHQNKHSPNKILA